MKNYQKQNIKFQNVVLFGFLFFNFFVLQSRAATIEKMEIDSNKKIEINGSCKDGVLNVQILSATSSLPFYTAGADCHENKFKFKDDLGYWKIPDGDYSVSIIGKDYNAHLSAATFKIQSVAPPASEENIVEFASNPSSAEEGIVEPPLFKAGAGGGQGETSDQPVILESQPDGLFAQIINFLMEWFKSAVVMIKELVVEKVSTPELCLGSTCIIEDQLKDLLGGKEKNKTVAPNPEILVPVSSSTIDAATTPIN